jgi:mono/diheme cytochrome c family protein
MQIVNITAIVLMAAITAISSGGAYKSAGVVTYTDNVKSIIDINCATACHTSVKPSGGIDLTTYEKVRQESLEGNLIPAIQHAKGVKPMPRRADKLNEATIQIMVSWVAGGALK